MLLISHVGKGPYAPCLYRPKLRNVNTESIRKPFPLCFLVTQLWDRKQLQGSLLYGFYHQALPVLGPAFSLIPRSGSPSLASFPGQGLPLWPHSQVRVSLSFLIPRSGSPPFFFLNIGLLGMTQLTRKLQPALRLILRGSSGPTA